MSMTPEKVRFSAPFGLVTAIYDKEDVIKMRESIHKRLGQAGQAAKTTYYVGVVITEPVAKPALKVAGWFWSKAGKAANAAKPMVNRLIDKAEARMAEAKAKAKAK